MSETDTPDTRDPADGAVDGGTASTGGTPDEAGSTTRMAAAAVLGVGSVAAAWYFYTNRDIWSNDAEPFYVLIFATVAVTAAGYLLWRLRTRRE